MKRLFSIIITIVILLSLPVNVYSKWGQSETANFNGQMGRVDMMLGSYSIDLSDDVLIPGWSDSKTLEITNTGNIPLVITGVINNPPSFLTISLDVPSGVVLPGGSITSTISCSIDPDLDQSFEDADASFSITFTGEQL